jgi:hypothetical protein
MHAADFFPDCGCGASCPSNHERFESQQKASQPLKARCRQYPCMYVSWHIAFDPVFILTFVSPSFALHTLYNPFQNRHNVGISQTEITIWDSGKEFQLVEVVNVEW